MFTPEINLFTPKLNKLYRSIHITLHQVISYSKLPPLTHTNGTDTHEESGRIGPAADNPLVSRTSFYAVSCDFSTVDISTAQALVFESAG